MLCEHCRQNDATKSLRVEPRENTQLGKSIPVCEDCLPAVLARYDNRSDRQVYVESSPRKGKDAWYGMTGMS